MLSSTARQVAVQGRPISPLVFKYVFDLHPGPINCATLNTTQAIANEPQHPYYIKVKRRHAAFDSSKLHWSVQVSHDISKRSSCRSRVRNRVRNAFEEELRSRGWDRDGTARDPKSGVNDLKGALAIRLSKFDCEIVLGSTYDAVRSSTQKLLDAVLVKSQRLAGRGRPRGDKPASTKIPSAPAH